MKILKKYVTKYEQDNGLTHAIHTQATGSMSDLKEGLKDHKSN